MVVFVDEHNTRNCVGCAVMPQIGLGLMVSFRYPPPTPVDYDKANPKPPLISNLVIKDVLQNALSGLPNGGVKLVTRNRFYDF